MGNPLLTGGSGSKVPKFGVKENRDAKANFDPRVVDTKVLGPAEARRHMIDTI